MMPGNSAWCLSTDHGVTCLGINLGITTALVWDTQADTQPHGYRYADSFVIEPQSTVRDTVAKKPVANMWCHCG